MAGRTRIWAFAAAALAGVFAFLHFAHQPGVDNPGFRGASVTAGLLMAGLIRGFHRLGNLPRGLTCALLAGGAAFAALGLVPGLGEHARLLLAALPALVAGGWTGR